MEKNIKKEQLNNNLSLSDIDKNYSTNLLSVNDNNELNLKHKNDKEILYIDVNNVNKNND